MSYEKARRLRCMQQLGCDRATARERLKKSIIFHLLSKLKENICCKCNLKIETIDDMSIEHISPWENINAELYWDLRNIAFSHLKCNIPHNRGGKFPSPKETARCSGHKDFLPIEKFHKNKYRTNGLNSECKKCVKDRQGAGKK